MREGPVFYIPNGAPGEEYAAQGDQPPGVVLFFRLYTGILAVLGAALVVLGFVLIVTATGPAVRARQELIGAAFYVVLGAAASVAHAIAFFGGRRGWVHTFGLLLIGFASLSCCCLPISLPLLLAWNKPEVKRWYTPPPIADDDEPAAPQRSG